MTSRRTWSDQSLVEAVESSKTVASILRKLGLQVRPGNYKTVQKRIKVLGLNTAHFTGKAHGTQKNRVLSNEDIFTQDADVGRTTVRRRIVKDELLGYTCQVCGSQPEWKGKVLTLVLDHINGKCNDHRLSNLRFLCPNCNSQQDTFCRGHSSNGRAEA